MLAEAAMLCDSSLARSWSVNTSPASAAAGGDLPTGGSYDYAARSTRPYRVSRPALALRRGVQPPRHVPRSARPGCRRGNL